MLEIKNITKVFNDFVVLKKICMTFREGEPFIAARPTLDAIETRSIQIPDHQFRLKEYATTSIEDIIIAAVRAQQEGAKAIVCAPIVSTTVEKIARVSVSACPVLQCRQPFLKAAEAVASKIILE